MRLLLAIMAWRLARRLGAPILVTGLAMVLLHNGAIPRQQARHTGRAVQHIIVPIEDSLRRVLRSAIRP